MDIKKNNFQFERRYNHSNGKFRIETFSNSKLSPILDTLKTKNEAKTYTDTQISLLSIQERHVMRELKVLHRKY